MRFETKIGMDNAAFADESEVTVDVDDGDRKVPTSEIAAGMELARILRDVADGCEMGGVQTGEEHPLLDSNGNSVGSWLIVDEAEADAAARRYVGWTAEHYHEQVDALADRIDRLATEIRRKGHDVSPNPSATSCPRYTTAAGQVAHAIAWGLANLNHERIIDEAGIADAAETKL